MKKKLFWSILTVIVAIGCFMSSGNSVLSNYSLTSLEEVEAIAACELPDGYSANGHCVSNDRNEHFCSNISGKRDCYQ